jgi:hypothetical protein
MMSAVGGIASSAAAAGATVKAAEIAKGIGGK